MEVVMIGAGSVLYERCSNPRLQRSLLGLKHQFPMYLEPSFNLYFLRSTGVQSRDRNG